MTSKKFALIISMVFGSASLVLFLIRIFDATQVPVLYPILLLLLQFIFMLISIKKTNMDEKISQRCDELFKLGMMFNGDSYIGKEDDNKDFNVHYTEIRFDSDIEFEKKLLKLTIELQRRRS